MRSNSVLFRVCLLCSGPPTETQPGGVASSLLFLFFVFFSAVLPSFIFRGATTNRNVVNSGFLYPLPVVQDEV